MPDNYFVSQTFESLLIPQQLADTLQLPTVSGSNLISPQTIAFVDRNIDDAMTVMANLRSDVKILLDPTRNGIAQITEALKQYHGLSSIDIISHGTAAQMQLGNSLLNANSVSQYANDLQQWRSALAPEADILFYGCNLAAGASGQDFINQIGKLTGADVAASTDLTGSNALGGNWDLEFTTGDIETSLAIDPQFQAAYSAVFHTTAALINAGGSTYTDSLGHVWSADQLFTGGTTYTTTAAIGNTISDPLFQTERYGVNFAYAIPVANGTYEIDLGFAELYWNTGNARLFNVTGEGQSLLSDYDIWTDAGGQNQAIVKKFNVNVSDGILNLNFAASKDQAKVSSIEVIPTALSPGLTPGQTGGNTAVTEGGATDSYSLVLNTQPTADVTVTLNPGTQLTTSAATLTFTPVNWNVAQSVTVAAVDDPVVEGNHPGTISHTVSSSDPNYSGLTLAPLSVAITDNDTNNIPGSTLIDAGGGPYTDGLGQVWSADQLFTGGTTYTTTADIGNTTSDPLFQTERTGVNFAYAIPVVNGSYEVDLGFTELYWNVANARLFSVTGEGQSLMSNYDVWTDAGGKNQAVIKKFTVNVTDGILNLNFAASKDQAKVDSIQVVPATLTPGIATAQTGGNTAVTEGGATDSYSLVLNTQPTSDVTVALNPGTQLTTNAATLTFTPVNWNLAQAVTVTAVNDTVVEGDSTGTISYTVSSSDASYNGLTIAPLSVAITDNDSNNVPGTLLINGGGGTYTDSLGQVWSADQLFTGGTTYTTTAAIGNTTSDPLFQTERTGVNFAYAIPVANGNYEVDLGFAELYWNAANARLFGVTGEGQLLLNNYDIWTDAGGLNQSIVKKFNVNVSDGVLNLNFAASKDQAKVSFIEVIPTAPAPGVTPGQTGGNTAVTEGGVTDSYSLVLNTQPTDDVTVTLNPDTQLTTSATTLTFTPTNWNVAQAVTVTAVNDTLVEGNHAGTITMTVGSMDPNYNGLTIAPLSVAITDNDANNVPGTIFINGGGGTYTDGLGQVWSADTLFTGGTTYTTTADIGNTTSDPLFQTERTAVNFAYAIPVANGNYEVDLGFAELYWNAANARLFNVTGEGQSLLNNYDIWTDAGGQNQAVTKKFAVNVSDGVLNLNFAASKDQAKVASIEVIPTAPAPGVTPTQTGGSTTVTEGGATDSYSLLLNTQPTANVTVTLNPGAQLTTSATTLTFTPANWNVAQAVTVTAVDDTLVEGSHTGTITHTVSSSDANYSGLTIASLSVAIADNDGSPTQIRIHSGGGAYTDSVGEAYLADQYFSGGGVYTTGAAIDGTIDDPLYQTERTGVNFAYAIPVVNGTYNIDLGFAELYWGAAGQRVFDVTVEGQLAIDDLDIWSQVGQNAALTKLVSGVAVSDNVLNINFTASKDGAKVSFIDVQPYVPDSSDPFLHVVIDSPSFVVDYNGNGSEVVPLLGNQSHTHEFGKNLTVYNWQTGSTVLGTAPDINAVLGLGQNSVSLTIGDNNTIPRTLTNSANIGVYPLNAVGGVLTKYYPTVSSYFPTLLDTLPSSPEFVEVLSSLKVTENAANGVLGNSDYNGDAIVVMNGKFQAATTGSYTFTVNGDSDERLFVNGTLVTGSVALTAGTKYDLEVRVARDAALTAPIEVLAAVNGGAATTIVSSSLTNDQSTLKPFINSMPSNGSNLGGEAISIEGIAFFEGDIASQVKVNWGNTVLTGSALTIKQGKISLTTPPGAGTIAVTVETPNGVSLPVNFTYVTGTVPINFTTPQVVANMTEPTQGTWGPDGRLYVGSISGQIKAYTFDDNYNVTATQTIGTISGLSNNNILGIAFNPYDTTGQPKIYISHSQLFANGGAEIPPGAFAPYSGQVSVLTGPNFATITPLITGLPVSNHDHGVNGMTFDDAGNLLIAVGSNTNAGIPATPLGSLPESPLSAAILKATINDPNFDGSIDYIDPATGQINNNAVFGGNVTVAPGVDVSVYAAGLRNPFDIVWTTNGLLYGLDNGPNQTFGAASTSATTQGADPNNPDELNLLLEGVYYGHPNRNRGQSSAIQNVYYGPNTASIPGVYMSPLTTIDSSTNGIDEYRATTFNGQLRGNLLGQKWNGTLYNFDLSPDGMQVATSTIANHPTGLDIIAGPGGALISVDYQDNYITVSQPIDAAAVGVTAYDIFPWRAPAAGGGSFTIGGFNFGNSTDTTVTIGGQTAILTSVSPTRIKGILPVKPTGTSGLLDIVVASAGATSTIANGFKYL